MKFVVSFINSILFNQFRICFSAIFVVAFFCGQNYRHSDYEEVEGRIFKVINKETKENFDSLNNILKHSKNECLQRHAVYNDASNYYALKNDLDKAEKKYLDAIIYIKDSKSVMLPYCYTSFIRMSATRLFYLYRRKGEYGKAMNIILKNREFLDPIEFKSLVGINDFDLGNYKKAISEFKTYLENIKNEKDSHKGSDARLNQIHKKRNLARVANIHNFVADGYVEIFKNSGKKFWLDSANIHYQKAFVNGNAFNQNADYNIALLNQRLAKTEFYKGNFQKAIATYLKNYNHTVLKDNPFTYQSYSIGLADSYLKLLKPKEALVYLKKFDSAYAEKPGSEEFKIARLSVYMDAFQQLGEDRKALEYANLYLKEIQIVETQKIIARDAQSLLNIEESNEKALKIVEKRDKNIKEVAFLTIGITLFVGTGIWIYRRIRKRNETSQVEFIEDDFQTENVDKNNLDKTKPILDTEEFENLQEKLLKFENNKDSLDPNFKLSSLAKKLGTNTSYLSAFFNLHLQKSFSIYLQEKRIEYLLDLLQKDKTFHKYTVQAISEHIGYKSTSAFSKVFEKIYWR